MPASWIWQVIQQSSIRCDLFIAIEVSQQSSSRVTHNLFTGSQRVTEQSSRYTSCCLCRYDHQITMSASLTFLYVLWFRPLHYVIACFTRPPKTAGNIVQIVARPVPCLLQKLILSQCVVLTEAWGGAHVIGCSLWSVDMWRQQGVSQAQATASTSLQWCTH